MQLYRVIAPVPDIEEAVRFYSGLFELDGERVSPGRHYFDLGGVVFAVYDPDADGDQAPGRKYHPNQYLYVSVVDIDAAFQRASRMNATLVSDRVQDMPWGERLFYARDPFGTPICFVDSQALFLGEANQGSTSGQ